MKTNAAMIGGGLIGRAWAMVFARAGWQVRLFDSVPAQRTAAHDYMAASLAEQQAYGLVDDAARALARIAVVERLEDAVADATWIQENLPEMLVVKREVFVALDRLALPSAIIASSTSALPASHFTEALPGRARCLVAHPVNPPHLVPVVELCGAPWTAPEIIARARDVMTAIGQTPVTIHDERDGFVLNRLQGALLSEAMRLVGEGVVSPEDLDRTVRDGLGLRWSFMGPFATIALNAPGGVDDYCARYGEFFRRLAADPAQPSVWEGANAAKVAAALGDPPDATERDARMRWRDRRLLALRRHKASEADWASEPD
ncbi:MAG: 3-hydroxyacyl-CoA dehydrogenase [Betaproteobacteria bacterium]|nr:MAG: 3-hydroxyacyl-CoA dehydrogenase [Betaproteobacteria bacterium]